MLRKSPVFVLAAFRPSPCFNEAAAMMPGKKEPSGSKPSSAAFMLQEAVAAMPRKSRGTQFDLKVFMELQ
jgi:hypothetical protein